MRRIALLAALALGACELSDSVSAVDPTARSANVRAARVLVMGFSDDLGERTALETAAVEALRSGGIQATPALDLFPPTRQYTTQEQADIITAQGYGFVLMAAPGRKGATTAYAPPVYQPGTSTTQVTGSGRYATATTTSTPGYFFGGMAGDMPTGGYRYNLMDMAQTAQARRPINAWTAQVTSRGGIASDYDALARAASREAVSRMRRDGII